MKFDKKILVICGPTATGKTDLAIKLAKRFDGELISADSRQVYKRMDIGTGKVPNSKLKTQNSKLRKFEGKWIVGDVVIRLYDVAEPDVQFTAADFYQLAHKVIREIWKRGKLPILVGGTGLYIKVVLEGLGTLGIPADLNLRKKLEGSSLRKLQNQLKELDPQKADRMNQSDWANPRRLIRAIEVAVSSDKQQATSETSNKRQVTSDKKISADVLKIGLKAPKENLGQRVDAWVKNAIKTGLASEVGALMSQGYQSSVPLQGMIYKTTVDFINKKIAKNEWETKLKSEMRSYVRRQLTWFKKDNQMKWFDIGNEMFPANVEELISKWYT